MQRNSLLIVCTAILIAANSNGIEPSFKLAAPKISRATASLPDFGAVGDGTTLNTEAFDKAITALAKKGGGKLVVPAGIWFTGPIKLQSHVELHLERGALIQFSRAL